MSKVNLDISWYPPLFPRKGRLPTRSVLVGYNCKQQDSLELAYRNELCKVAERRVEPPCCKTLHISIFFDGTGNNINNDVFLSKIKHPTNIARLFRATIGQGYAGGVPGNGETLVDPKDTSGNKYYKYYIPGVGTPFPEVMDLDYSTPGLAAATYGEERINWALIRIIDALRRTLGLPELSDAESWKSVKAMTSKIVSSSVPGYFSRLREFRKLLKDIEPSLKLALQQPEPGKPKLLGIKLYVYGFSRGAASARAFINWLVRLLPGGLNQNAKPELCLTLDGADWKLPLSVEFLGLLDTVASVGVAHISPFAEGHMGWADGAMELPDNGLIKNCVHFASAHEQRLCFPLDSICRHDGTYPSYAKEVVYPGMHSDIGGGYPPGDQGKASVSNGDDLLSQIALNDLYAAAFSSGAPLKVIKESLPDDLVNDKWRALSAEQVIEFSTTESLAAKFNSWRQLTLNIYSDYEVSDEDTYQYKPIRCPVNIIEAINDQLAWITAWRIGRYANGSYKTIRFYIDSAADGMDKDSDPDVREKSESERDKAQAKTEGKRTKLRMSRWDSEYIPLPPGIKDFDPALGQTQLREAAEEFRADYQKKPRPRTGNYIFRLADSLSGFVYIFSDDDKSAEYERIKKSATDKVKILFSSQHDDSAAKNLVVALFDDQIHDSRAWFLHGTFGDREPWGSYFLYRMIYFGEVMSKNVTPIIKYGRFLEWRMKKAVPWLGVVVERYEKMPTASAEASGTCINQKISLINTSENIQVENTSKLRVQLALTNTVKGSNAIQHSINEEQFVSTKSAIAELWS